MSMLKPAISRESSSAQYLDISTVSHKHRCLLLLHCSICHLHPEIVASNALLSINTHHIENKIQLSFYILNRLGVFPSSRAMFWACADLSYRYSSIVAQDSVKILWVSSNYSTDIHKSHFHFGQTTLVCVFVCAYV